MVECISVEDDIIAYVYKTLYGFLFLTEDNIMNILNDKEKDIQFKKSYNANVFDFSQEQKQIEEIISKIRTNDKDIKLESFITDASNCIGQIYKTEDQEIILLNRKIDLIGALDIFDAKQAIMKNRIDFKSLLTTLM